MCGPPTCESQEVGNYKMDRLQFLAKPSKAPSPEISSALSDDFAEEAAYHTVHRLAKHPPPPELRAHCHVWGISDDYCDEPRDRGKDTNTEAPYKN